MIEYQLQTYVNNIRSNLFKKLVETKKHEIYSLLYLFIKLVLTLSIATTSLQKVFSNMNIVKKIRYTTK